MATSPNLRLHNRKRQYAEAGLSHDNLASLPSKKFKSTEEPHFSSNLPPPAFWDNLSKIPLTRRAVKELDRRNAQPTSPQSYTKSQFQRPHTRGAVRESKRRARPLIPVSEYLSEASQAHIVLLKAFARHGGPELSDMRGYRELNESTSSSRASSRPRKSTDPTTTTTKSKKSNPYDRAFEQNLIDHGVYLNNRARKPENIEEIKVRLANPRPSLSPSKFSDSAFEAFQASDSRAKDEDDVMTNVVPVISGKDGEKDFSARNTIFGNLEPLTDGNIVPPKPDLYYGSRPEQLNRQTRQELSSYIIPSTQEDKPMAPNFYLEAKGPDGTPSVAKRQAAYNAGVGARGMQELQSYGAGKPIYDNNAYTITSTLQNGHLVIYATHPTAPTGPGKSPEYHMTQLRSFALSDTVDTCRQGLTAFRNSKDVTREWRDGFILAANKSTEQLARKSSQYNGPLYAIDTHEESQTSADEHAPISSTYLTDESQTSADEFGVTSFAFPPQESQKSTHELINTLAYPKDDSDFSTDELALDAPLKPPVSKKRPNRGRDMSALKAPRQSTESSRRRRRSNTQLNENIVK